MKIADDSPPIVSALDRPNSYIGPFPQDTPINASFPCVSRGTVYPMRCLSVSPGGSHERRFPLHEMPASDLVSGLHDPAGPAQPSPVNDLQWEAEGDKHRELGHQSPREGARGSQSADRLLGSAVPNAATRAVRRGPPRRGVSNLSGDLQGT